MDKSLHNQLFGGVSRSPFGSRTRQSSASSIVSGRKSMGGSGGGGIKKGSNTGRFSVSGRSTQSLAGIRSECNVVESFGFQLPVLVNEALTFSERNCGVSINCSSNGWAWALHGRRLLVWQYKDNRQGSPKYKDLSRTPQRRTTTAQCRELTLPHCDIGHKASLVTVFQPDGQQMASCLAVSPTGDVRYWPSIAHDGSSIDSNGILDGQEFDFLLPIPPQGYLLVTTTCNLLFLQLQVVNGRHVIHHRTVKAPSGFFGGIGKKFASIIIGMNSGHDKENKFVKVDSEKVSDNEWNVIVLADRWVQKWIFSNNGNEQLLFEENDVMRKIRDEFHQKFWNGRAESTEIEINLLDMQISDGKVYVFAGAVNTSHTPQMHYAIVILEQEPEYLRLSSFIPLKLSQFYSTGTEVNCLQLRFIICRSYAYLYCDKTIYPVNLLNPTGGDLEAEKIEFQLQDDHILSAAVCGNIPLFFSRNHGLVCVSPSDFDNSDFLNSSYSPDVFTPPFSDSLNNTAINQTVNLNSLSMYELDPDEIFNDNKDEVSQLKAAFIYHIKRNNTMCTSILKDLVPADIGLDELDGQLDKTVVAIAEDLAEDIPAADPRWEQVEKNLKHSLGSSSSLQIISQLKEKNMALSHFVDFLHSTGLWDKLNAVSYRGLVKPTCYVVSDINEKIIAAIALKMAHNKHNKLIDEALEIVISQWKEFPSGNLTSQDLFYVRLTQFQDVIQALCQVADSKIESHHQSSAIAAFLCDLNAIILSILHEVISFREQNMAKYILPADKSNSYEYLPWTAMSGKNGLRDSLTHLISITVKYGAKSTGEPEIKYKLYQQIMELIDFVLDGRKNYLESIKDNEKYGVLLQQYESQRKELILILIDEGQYELAAKLAEKYLDFQSLVVICDQTGNQDRLDGYIEKYQEYDFSQFAINWHLRQNRQGDVFERFKGNQAALSQFLRDHPSLGWIQLIFNGDFDRAAGILFQLGQDETEFVQRKKSILSLAKLASLAADSDLSNQVTEINAELNLVDYQEQLNEQLLLSYGYDVENPKVLKAEEIINLFISEENETATEFDFRKAIELLNYVDDPCDVRHKIWCAAILRDSWTHYDMNSALDYLQNTIFFKLIEVCYLMDGDFDEFLPSIDEFLNSSDLGSLTQDKSFQYLIKLAYEHITDSFQKGMDQE
ncbi:nuclear pore complex protein Nup133 [Eupeodes corollae]|uniref:nuclear pore complex protein Nup133 n=1 Tax=Eupeodes corollae TaxID=290404 RepID=UPI002492F84F|nr:nuclear pore complex protein Nup133 [Eupeodes corollae]